MNRSLLSLLPISNRSTVAYALVRAASRLVSTLFEPREHPNWAKLCRFPILTLLLLIAYTSSAADSGDVILRAMRAELDRAHNLKFANLESPYYVEANVDDVTSFTAAATLGGLLNANHGHFRVPRVEVRVGSYKFDNTNYIGSGYTYGSNYDVDRLPLEDNFELLRRYLWLAIDRAYKSAVESISRKRAALKNVSNGEHPDDFAPADPLRRMEPVSHFTFDEEPLQARVRSLSAIFAQYPELRNSSVEFSGVHNIRYMATTEGTEIRLQEHVSIVRARASIQAPDGMMLRDAVVFHSGQPGVLASEREMARGIVALAENVSALAKAPIGEGYNGPVIFEREAAAQVLAQVIGKNLALTRKPVTEPGRPGVFPTSELEGRFGARILPEWMDIVDDPTQIEWRGHPLFGHYTVDMDGIAPQPLALVEKGMLKNFLLTRLPMRNFPKSNGHARLQGGFGANAAGFRNGLSFFSANRRIAAASGRIGQLRRLGESRLDSDSDLPCLPRRARGAHTRPPLPRFQCALV
jgi:TldD protein